MKNLAGNVISIFLFQFVLRERAISFVLNEGIAGDMYAEIDREIQPLAKACCETLSQHRQYCQEKIIMDGNILVDGHFEVMLSKGLGRYIEVTAKDVLFNNAHKIAKLLIKVMEGRQREIELGTYSGPQQVINKII